MNYALTLIAPDGSVYDVTDRLALDGVSTLTLVIERNLHEFRAGDLTVTLDNEDGFLTDLWSALQTTDRWRMTAERDGERHFSGVIFPVDSIHFDTKQATVEVTALDLSKALDDVVADTVARSVSLALTATASAGASTLTLNSTASLYAGDKLLLLAASGFQRETVEIALVTSATQVTLTQVLAGTYTTAATVTLVTPFFRYKTPDFLINALLDAAGSLLSGRVVSLGGGASNIPIFSDQSTNRLDQLAVPVIMQKGGQQHAAFAATSFFQTTPDADWTSESPFRNWMDWTPYRTQAQGEPGTHANNPGANAGIDFTPGALVAYNVNVRGGSPALLDLNKFTSADGLTWTGPTLVSLIGSAGVGNNIVGFSADYDSTRNRVYYVWRSDVATQEFGYYDIGGASDNTISTASAYSLAGSVRYSAEADVVVLFNSASRKIERWRDTTKLGESAALSTAITADLRTTRYLQGRWWFSGFNEGVPTVFYSDDDFATINTIPLGEPIVTGPAVSALTIVNGQIRIATQAQPDQGASQCKLYVGAPIFAGIIPYADFSNMSITNALDELAMILNGIFSVDVQGVAYFVLRELDSGSPTLDVTDLVLERQEDPIWLETYDYVEVSVGNGVASAGTKTSVSRNLSVQVQLATTLGVGTAIALYLYAFFRQRRRMARVNLEDRGDVFRLLDPVTLDGAAWLIYSVERDLVNYAVALDLLERVSA